MTGEVGTEVEGDGEVAEAIAGSDALERVGRVGLITRGVVHLVSAALTLEIATAGYSDDGPGRIGALEAAADQPYGQVLLVLLAVGFAGLALWRLAAAVVHESDGGLFDLWRFRLSPVGEGLLHLTVVVIALFFLFDPDRSTDSGRAGRLLALPGGRWLALLIASGLFIAAGWNGYKAVTGRYREDWLGELTGVRRRIATAVSSAGLIGQAAVHVLIGFFLARSGVTYDPTEPRGLDQAVRELATGPNGTAYLLLLAVGMSAYAGYSFVEARWREVLER